MKHDEISARQVIEAFGSRGEVGRRFDRHYEAQVDVEDEPCDVTIL